MKSDMTSLTLTKNIINLASHNECATLARENHYTYRKLATVIEDTLTSICDEIQQADRSQPLGAILADIHNATTKPQVHTTEGEVSANITLGSG